MSPDTAEDITEGKKKASNIETSLKKKNLFCSEIA